MKQINLILGIIITSTIISVSSLAFAAETIVDVPVVPQGFSNDAKSLIPGGGQAYFFSIQKKGTAVNYEEVYITERELVAIENEIKDQLASITERQINSDEKTQAAVSDVEGKNGFTSALFGADYQSISLLTDEMIERDVQIKELEILLKKTKDIISEVKLGAKIRILKNEQVRIDLFINKYQNNFSFFGWFIRAFVE